MPINDQTKSFATKDSNTYKLYENRKIYKENVLTTDSHGGSEPAYIRPAFADFWYDRFLFGKINRTGDIIIPREDFLSPLQNKNNRTLYALDFVAVAFNEFRAYFQKNVRSNNIPNKNTLFASIEPALAWQSIYDEYHEYISFVYGSFYDYMRETRGNDKIINFEDFVDEFFIFCQNIITSAATQSITLSGFVTNNTIDAKCGGLTIDLFRARASNDIVKSDLFIKDINFNFYVDAANKHGFTIDKNVPWRLQANLSSEYMKMLMESEAFGVTYDLGEDNIFDTYYLKTYTLDLILLRKYIYDMYSSMVSSKPAFTKQVFCNNTQKIKKIFVQRKPLTMKQREKTYNVRDYWLNLSYRLRLLELKNDLLEVDIAKHVKNAQSIYDIRGEMQSLKYLHDQTKRFFIHNYNKARTRVQIDAPKHE